MFEKKENIPTISLKDFENMTEHIHRLEIAAIELINDLDIAVLPYTESTQTKFLKISSRYIRDLLGIKIVGDALEIARKIEKLCMYAPKDFFQVRSPKPALDKLIDLLEEAVKPTE